MVGGITFGLGSAERRPEEEISIILIYLETVGAVESTVRGHGHEDLEEVLIGVVSHRRDECPSPKPSLANLYTLCSSRPVGLKQCCLLYTIFSTFRID